MADPNVPPNVREEEQSFIDKIYRLLGHVDLDVPQVLRLRATGITSVMIVGAGSYTVYRLVTDHPDMVAGLAAAVITNTERQVIQSLSQSSMLVDVLVENRRAGEELLNSLESGNMLRKLKKTFDNVLIEGEKITFDSIELVEVKLVKATKDFSTLKKEAEERLSDFVTKHDKDQVKSKVDFCDVEVERVVKVPEGVFASSTSTDVKDEKAHASSDQRKVRLVKEIKSNQLALNGVPYDFNCFEAERLLKEVLNDDTAVTKVRYMDNPDGSMNKSTIVVQLRTSEMLGVLLTDSSAKAQLKKVFHQTSGATDKENSELYEVKMCGVPKGFDFVEAQNLLQEIVNEGTVVTDVDYLKNEDGSLKKSTIVARMKTPKYPSPDKDTLKNKLWFIKSRFQRSKTPQVCQNQMLLVKQPKGRKRNLDEDLHVIDMLKG